MWMAGLPLQNHHEIWCLEPSLWYGKSATIVSSVISPLSYQTFLAPYFPYYGIVSLSNASTKPESPLSFWSLLSTLSLTSFQPPLNHPPVIQMSGSVILLSRFLTRPHGVHHLWAHRVIFLKIHSYNYPLIYIHVFHYSSYFPLETPWNPIAKLCK